MRRAGKSYRREPTRQEMVRWRKLALAARSLADNPSGPAGDFLKARKATVGKVMPPSLYSTESPLYALTRLADNWSDIVPADRGGAIFLLGVHADEVLAELARLEGAAKPPAPAKRFRKDIDG